MNEMSHLGGRCISVGMNATQRAIAYVIDQWIVAGIDRDSDEEVLWVVGEPVDGNGQG